MQSGADGVWAYLAELSEDRREIVAAVRTPRMCENPA